MLRIASLWLHEVILCGLLTQARLVNLYDIGNNAQSAEKRRGDQRILCCCHPRFPVASRGELLKSCPLPSAREKHYCP